MNGPVAVLVDVEGTVTPVAFVHEVLFPYARARMRDWCGAHAGEAVLGGVGADVLLGWMTEDRKETVLKDVQGRIWREGYERGEIVGRVYADVAPALVRWAEGGVRLYVYSSGSVEAQRLLFGYSQAGDLAGLFGGFFDTRVGGKREASSYAEICREVNLAGGELLFLSDVEAELDAAAGAGLLTCQLVRAADGTVAGARHEVARDFGEVAGKFGLPGGR